MSSVYFVYTVVAMNLYAQGYESTCEKKSEIIWNGWKDVLFNALIKGLKMGFCEEEKSLKSD